ncbi:hypothetical protein QTI33_01290 [Variovorax sp. J22P271]|uniref:hypothetical protein n=1 Tax=Variovorax davisae TaxID=3053515 RepID=UPI002576C34C|nr:hypothetical protein [Variovorax sp. J22P271]MDM0030773.1 hypothetical protein [Variovorax sp. J22P271]
MDHLCFSRRPDPAPDGLFGGRRPRLAPEKPDRPRAADSPPQPLTPAELAQVARAWRRRADGSSILVAQALETLAARRAPPPVETLFAAPPPKSVVRRISEFMGL